ncbi:RNA polymerase II transcription factor B subunit 1 [Teratosphaeriaceae sp. CCFEE 6253]|nr:RNA polymerase II transcription factor B subunit 1 [Teratosphaeriaceae sp. CCFEE 6253]
MPSTRATCSYKKKDGSLTISDDTKYLFWTPSTPPAASPSVTVPIADITNLQQTPAVNPKIALKVFVTDVNYVFSFPSSDAARKEQEAITDTLRNAITTLKDAATSSLTPARKTATNGDGNAGQSAAMSIAKALSAQPQDDDWYDDGKLKSDFQLQRSLLESNKALNDRFAQALREKPDAVTVPQFTAQFWSTRLHHLRTHAIEKAQREGEYNVLPEIKPITIMNNNEPEKKLNLTKEQVALVFKQYPVVLQAFDENVPKSIPDPAQFWSRFFVSRLLKTLKGMRIEKHDPTDPILDRYLDHPAPSDPASTAHIPHIIDLEGNEAHTKFRLEGDYEMRAARHDRPILHILNRMSEKLLSHVAPEDGEAHGPIGMDEGTFEQLQLRDLAMRNEDNRVVLNVREQQRDPAAHREDDLSADARLYAKQDPADVIARLRGEVQAQRLGSDEQGTLKLDRVIGFQDQDDDDDDEDMDDETNGVSHGTKSASRIGSHAAISAASTAILSSISQRRLHTSPSSSDTPDLYGLSQATYDTLTLTHNTTTEFLHYFWPLFLSGDSSRAAELAGLVVTLDRSVDRIQAVGEQAEREREARVERMREQVREYTRRTGKKRRVDEGAVGGGKAVVDGMVGPTVRALGVAGQAYRRALEAQMKEASVVAA